MKGARRGCDWARDVDSTAASGRPLVRAVAAALLLAAVSAVGAQAAELAPDERWGPGGWATLDPNVDLRPSTARLTAAVPAPDGGILAVGRLTFGGDPQRPSRVSGYALKLRADGRPDPSFGNGGRATLNVATAPGLPGYDRVELRDVKPFPGGGWVIAGHIERPATASEAPAQRRAQALVLRLAPNGRFVNDLDGDGIFIDPRAVDTRAEAVLVRAGAVPRITYTGKASPLGRNDGAAYTATIDPDGRVVQTAVDDPIAGRADSVDSEAGAIVTEGDVDVIAGVQIFRSGSTLERALVLARVPSSGPYQVFNFDTFPATGEPRIGIPGAGPTRVVGLIRTSSRYVVAATARIGSVHRVRLAAFTHQGLPDNRFGRNGLLELPVLARGGIEAEQLVPLANGRMLLAGTVRPTSGTPFGFLARLLPDGALDKTFFGDGLLVGRPPEIARNAEIGAVAVSGTGVLTAVGGTFGDRRVNLAAWRFARPLATLACGSGLLRCTGLQYVRLASGARQTVLVSEVPSCPGAETRCQRLALTLTPTSGGKRTTVDLGVQPSGLLRLNLSSGELRSLFKGLDPGRYSAVLSVLRGTKTVDGGGGLGRRVTAISKRFRIHLRRERVGITPIPIP